MAKKLEWNIDIDGTEHTVSLAYGMVTGKAVVVIDGDSFDISTGFMKLRGTNQAFRLGDKQAILDFPKRGEPDIILDGVGVHSGKKY
ncbi:MAG: hypothetical protein ACI3XQ_03485 [Eubacteriales bacterium]